MYTYIKAFSYSAVYTYTRICKFKYFIGKSVGINAFFVYRLFDYYETIQFTNIIVNI